MFYILCFLTQKLRILCKIAFTLSVCLNFLPLFMFFGVFYLLDMFCVYGSVCVLCVFVTFRAVLADIGPLGVALVLTGLTALIKGHTQVTAVDQETR